VEEVVVVVVMVAAIVVSIHPMDGLPGWPI